ncbi:hypothetical protein [Pontibacter sp. BAB1700]|uniref:hypothetical protein n=1 Tax=Pontibacter sp. BAB1700 TaxID=1144253 RepID=UPI00026BD647|nr:hypothetical protein [Pontibacter sp. BAB1700]EJF09040.1 hypothetical protein O71_17291 [Pontibacter sp. BAB1700]
MKTGIVSVLIGVIGLIVITYYQAEESLVLGDVQHTVASYPMSLSVVMSLFAVEALGIVLGYFAFRRRYVKLGLSGIGLCALCLILLYGYAF